MADSGDDPQEVHSGTHSPAAESKSGTPLKDASRSKVTLLGSNQYSPDPGFGSGKAPSDIRRNGPHLPLAGRALARTSCRLGLRSRLRLFATRLRLLGALRAGLGLLATRLQFFGDLVPSAVQGAGQSSSHTSLPKFVESPVAEVLR